MSNKLRKLFNKYQTRLGELGGQECSIYRPDYTVVDNSLGSPLNTNKKYKVEIAGPRFAQRSFTNVAYVAIFGNRNLIQAGDVIVPTESGSSTPALTVLNISPIEEAVGFFTERIGKITLNTTDPTKDIYTNIRYQWVSGSGFPGSAFTDQLRASLAVPIQKVVLYSRDNISPENVDYEVQGMYFVETDGSFSPDANETQRRWIIKLVEKVGNLTQLTLEQDH